ncbi:hypothetical protein SAMN05660653_02788 [Desulfonatronum thiosulfatophilum]|uniref:GspL periplasmic domain-containing protein n=2 Tax=Desulfonatronum thiosulfatophilum TaxID=617002 RepID=A0A1G6EDR0_9BACT|nr:hypothetical protein SAMN05660653_02788 [Desulfonatronum thiosulfatophilum]
MPVLVLLPERFFFFFQPDIANHVGSHRQLAAAAKLQIEQMFPAAPFSGNGSGIVSDAGRNHFLGYFHHPALAAFSRRHHDTLRRANAVTTPLFLAWNAGFLNGGRDWAWEEPEEGTFAFLSGNVLNCFHGDEAELRKRLAVQPMDGENASAVTSAPRRWQLNDLLQVAPVVGWSALRLPLPAENGNRADLRKLAALCVAAALLGGLFSLGQALRLSTQMTQLSHLEQATNTLYSEALSLPLGDDPFGRLLFRLSQLQGRDQTGPDPLSMLGVLSSSAPPGFHVESFSMGPNTGTIRARLADYEQLESLLRALEGHGNLRFDLDQASSSEADILVTLRVSY